MRSVGGGEPWSRSAVVKGQTDLYTALETRDEAKRALATHDYRTVDQVLTFAVREGMEAKKKRGIK